MDAAIKGAGSAGHPSYILSHSFLCRNNPSPQNMSFGWAPSEQLRSRNGGQGLDFFSRLEADQKCMPPWLAGTLTVARERSVEPPQGILRRKDIPRLHDVILRELNRTKHAPPQPTENLDTILHGDIDVILSIRQEVCRLLQSEVGAKRRKKERAKSHSPPCVVLLFACANISLVNRHTKRLFAV